MKILFASKIFVMAICLSLSNSPCSAATSKPGHKHKVRLNIDGTYKASDEKLRVTRYGKNHIWFYLNAHNWGEDSAGHFYIRNIGECEGIIPIKGNKAVWNFDLKGEPPSKLVFKFSRGQCDIEQTGDCGFGYGVHADGTYIRVSRKVSR